MVNVQTEHLDNHTARLTVEVDAERIEQAMRQAARRVAQKARIRGFRPGKAPYNVVVSLYGREYILGEALDQLGNEIYREALEASELEPYAPGSLEDVEEDGHKLVFVVPKQPTVELGDYRAIRVEVEQREVTDEMVAETMETIRQDQAVVEPADRAARMGDQVKLAHLVATVIAGDPEPEVEDTSEGASETSTEQPEPAAEASVAEGDTSAEAEAPLDDAADAHDHDHEGEPSDGRVVVHQHDATRILRDDNLDLFAGFSEQLVGMSAGEEKEFLLTVPADDEDDEIAGRTLRVEVHVAAVESRTVPEWSDALAQRASESRFETILELRADIRRRLQESLQNMAKQQVADQALDALVEGATIHFPADLVDDYIDGMLEELDTNMRQQGITLADFKRITGKTDEELAEQYRPRAEERAKRVLALTELVRQEGLVATPEDIETQIDHISQRLGGDQSSQFRQFFASEQSRANISNQLATDRALDRLVAIARGEDPASGVDRDAEAAARAEEMAEMAAALAVNDAAEIADEPAAQLNDSTPTE